MQLGKIAVRGGLITGSAQALKILIQFASVIILARLLTPEEFGIFASIGPFIAFVALFKNLGLQQAVVQRKDITDAQLNQVFWIMALVGAACAVMICLLSPAIALFYGDSRMQALSMAAAAPLLVTSLAALPLSLMNRRLWFGRLAINDVVATVLGFAATLAAALAGAGYWSPT
ncbi:MAG: oligosaccharide flippase family protein, partial [Pseudomonadota bacterium]